jgi:predicted Fe-S protein YdhL (DUF1289 family)
MRMPIDSPCINVCALDAGGRICLGCGRDIDEIARWGGMDDEERWQVLERIAARRAARERQSKPRKD